VDNQSRIEATEIEATEIEATDFQSAKNQERQMRKILFHYNQKFLCTTLKDKEEPVTDDESYDAFHAAVGQVLGDLAGDMGGIDGLIIRFDEGLGPLELASANFSMPSVSTAHPGCRFWIAQVTFVAE